MRGVGALGTYISNFGPCDHNQTYGNCHYSRRGDVVPFFRFFEIPLIAGAPPSEFSKIAQAHPGAGEFVRGGGWTVLVNGTQTGSGTNFQNGPADGSIGHYFSGALSTEDGACTDNSGDANGYLDAGVQLLGASDCPATWPAGGFAGPRPVPPGAWHRLFENPLAAPFDSGRFQWNDWQVPDSLRDATRFLGTFSTYGATTDHHSGIRPRYGGVVPGGAGPAEIDGYPLGLRWEFDAFSYDAAPVASVVFWRARIINRSADVYGAGISYDSLYAGFMPGAQIVTPVSEYYLPQHSAAHYVASNNTHGMNCGPERIPPGVSACWSGPDGGYRRGADFIVVLKSPIGDLRNKLFTRRPDGAPCSPNRDPFCDPAHPDRGDTITFNHGHMCGFGGCWANMLNVSDKRAFGLLASIEDVVVDGRSFTANTASWRPFRNYEYPAVFGKFNKFVPGVHPWTELGLAAGSYPSWDWNDDGRPDTLFFDSCHVFGCVGTAQDTMPGGQVNAYGNIGGIVAAGPFRLAAGDTTAFYAAFITETDSVRAWSALAAATDLYLSLFLGPAAPPAPRIVGTAVTPQLADTGGPSVRLFLSEDPELWTDPYLEKLAGDIESAPPGTDLAILRDLNPDLVEQVRARAADNLEQIEIYKSCDSGKTFTADSDCLPDPAVDVEGDPVGSGWRAYAVFRRDDPQFRSGLPNAFTDEAVRGGRNYLYVVAAKSRGATFLLVTPAGADLVRFAPPLRTPLAAAPAGSRVSLYVPVSRAAGGHPPTVAFAARPARSTIPLELMLVDSVVPGRYEAIFGNRVVVDEVTDVARAEIVRSIARVEHEITADSSGVPVPVLLRRETFVREGRERVAIAGTPLLETPAPDTMRRTLPGLGFVLVRGSTLFFASEALTGAQTTPPALYGSALFPGFSLTTRANLAGLFAWERVVLAEGPDDGGQRTGSNGDAPDSLLDWIVHWRPVASFPRPVAGGHGVYRVTWTSEPFGLPNGVELDFTEPERTQAAVHAALATRAAPQTGVTDFEAAELVTDALIAAGLLISDSSTVTLVPARLPFTVVNATHERPVEVAMVQRRDSIYLLGSGEDTLRITLPPHEWVPGDRLALLETVLEDSTTGAGVVLGGDGRPIRLARRRVTFARAVLGCGTGSDFQVACNPVKSGTPGAGTYLPVLAAGDVTEFHYYVGFTPEERIAFDLARPLAGAGAADLTRTQLAQVRVVPNPFILASSYGRDSPETAPGAGRVLFTGLPASGTIRIYTVAGQFVQQVRWTPQHLTGSGDLLVELSTRGGRPMVSGLYIWVLRAGPLTQRGKFVIVR